MSKISAKDPDEIIDGKEVALIAKVHQQTIYSWVQDNKIPHYRLGWRCVRFRRGDVEEFLKRAFVPATAPAPPSRKVKKPAKQDVLQPVPEAKKGHQE